MSEHQRNKAPSADTERVRKPQNSTLETANHTPPNRILQLQRMVGNRAATQLLQRVITTQTTSRTATQEHGVTALTAIIGGRPFGGRGSNPQDGEPNNITKVGPLWGRYVGGHMLNQEMGGNGTWDNMIVQSQDSNKKMNKHDNVIKRLSDRANSVENAQKSLSYTGKKYEFGVKETIVVDDAAPTGGVSFVSSPSPDADERYTGEQYIPQSLTVTLEPIMQKLGDPFTRKAWAVDEELPYRTLSGLDAELPVGHKEDIAPSYFIPNVPPYPALKVDKPTRKRKGMTGTLTVNLKKRKPKDSTRARLKLGGKNANGLSKKQFMKIPGIGATLANALHSFFQANSVSLSTVTLTQLKNYNKSIKQVHLDTLNDMGLL